MDKKRKKIPPELELGSNQHSSSITSSHPTPIPSQLNSDSKELEVSQAKVTPVFPHEVCIDGWTITYTKFKPQKIKRAKKRSSQTKMNLQSQQADNTLSNNYAMEVARVRSIQDYHQQLMMTHYTKEAHDEIDVVDDVSLPCERCPCNHAIFKN